MKLKHIALAALMATATAASAEVKIALDTAPDPKVSGTYNWVQAFGKTLTDAGMDVREMPRDSVGNEAEKLDQLSTGLLEVSLSDVRSIAQVDPFIYGLRLPYIFDDAAHMQRALADGEIFERVNDAIAGQDIMLLAIVPLGPSSGIITTDAAVRTPEDMADLRMRALDDAQIAMYKAWGTTGTIVPWGEVPAGLQTGVIDGYLNSPFVPIAFGQTDFVKNFADSRTIIPIRAVIVSKMWYDGLSDDERSAVNEAVTKGNAATQAWLDEVSASSLTALEDAGVTVQRLSDEERGAFRDLSRQVYDSGLMPAEDVKVWTDLSEASR
ncbi:TRAP transporter substrate-binding protein [Phaeobacter sp. HF9A]|uniref:TRAP transporter substrate-binding protein n=1 Tax=Phaeobacter sp. HF9A TaxID=2721561 RepID=UPI00142F5D47|nr:TRAP transporter substrate-binding protein [Phaeobacter sp. HF9A]NIZ13143.1 TRAP transporter substrate-binding protein [Phaeobacter sp. HF9A]